HHRERLIECVERKTFDQIANCRLPIANLIEIRNLSEKSAIGNWQLAITSFFRRVVSVAGADLCFVFHAAHFEFDRAKLSIASFVGWIVAETVERADVLRDPRKCRARVGQRRRHETPAARGAREIVHLTAREVVKIAADRHALERSHLAKAVEILCLRFREKELSITLYLSLRQRKLPVI